jgi:hypothetical protein
VWFLFLPCCSSSVDVADVGLSALPASWWVFPEEGPDSYKDVSIQASRSGHSQPTASGAATVLQQQQQDQADREQLRKLQAQLKAQHESVGQQPGLTQGAVVGQPPGTKSRDEVSATLKNGLNPTQEDACRVLLMLHMRRLRSLYSAGFLALALSHAQDFPVAPDAGAGAASSTVTCSRRVHASRRVWGGVCQRKGGARGVEGDAWRTLAPLAASCMLMLEPMMPAPTTTTFILRVFAG